MRTLFPSLLALLLVPACDSSSKPSGPSEAEAKAAAEEAASAKRIDERRKKREAETKRVADEEAAKQEQIAALCIVPEGKHPKKLGQACQGVVDAEVAFLERNYADKPEALAKLKSASQMQTQMTMQMCQAGASMEVALCQKHALDNAPKEFKKELAALKRTCVDKFGAPPKGGAAPAVPKKPG